MKNKIFTLIILVFVVSFSYADLDRAESSFKTGISILEKDREKALELLRLSREEYLSLVDSGIENAEIYYNIGNISVLIEDIPYAILSYKKSLLYSQKRVYKRALDYARSLNGEVIKEPSYKIVMKIIFFWHYYFSFATKLWLGLLLLFLFFIFLFVYLFFSKKSMKALMIITLCFFVINSAFAFTDYLLNSKLVSGVIMKDCKAFKGDNKIYDNAFDRDLPAGSEFILLEDRDNWLKIKLLDDNTCWVEKCFVDFVLSPDDINMR